MLPCAKQARHYNYNCPATGQNLAREWDELSTPEDRVTAWYDEHEYYTYSKFASPMGPAACSKEPCDHFTQVLILLTNINMTDLNMMFITFKFYSG